MFNFFTWIRFTEVFNVKKTFQVSAVDVYSILIPVDIGYCFAFVVPDKHFQSNQVVIAQWLEWRLATRVVPGSNPGKGKNLLISD